VLLRFIGEFNPGLIENLRNHGEYSVVSTGSGRGSIGQSPNDCTMVCGWYKIREFVCDTDL
jgi:hypothetical protein